MSVNSNRGAPELRWSEFSGMVLRRMDGGQWCVLDAVADAAQPDVDAAAPLELAGTATAASPDEEAYRYLADRVIDLFNPRDDDIAEEALLADHLQWVHDYIASLPCVCLPGAAGPDFNEPPCDRCVALGFAANVRIDRG